MKKLVMLGLLSACCAAQANELHNKISALTDEQRQAVFVRMMQREGEACGDVTRTFFQGRASGGAAFWSFSCRPGKDWQVVFAGSDGTQIKLLDCKTLARVGAPKCFERFK